jgi:hypothetical protein
LGFPRFFGVVVEEEDDEEDEEDEEDKEEGAEEADKADKADEEEEDEEGEGEGGEGGEQETTDVDLSFRFFCNGSSCAFEANQSLTPRTFSTSSIDVYLWPENSAK